jgi:hypothetical protein
MRKEHQDSKWWENNGGIVTPFVLFILNIWDLLGTMLISFQEGVSLSSIEKNPVMKAVISEGGVTGFITIKILVSSLVCLLFWIYWEKAKRLHIFTYITCILYIITGTYHVYNLIGNG